MIAIAVSAFALCIVQMAAVVSLEYPRPYKAIAWVVIVTAVPLLGFALYLFMGKEYVSRSLLNRSGGLLLEQMKERLEERCGENGPGEQAEGTGLPDGRLRMTLTRPGAFPVTAGNDTKVYAEGGPAFHDMLEDIASARHHVHIEFYIIRDDLLGSRFQELLMQKAREGVKVRLIYDGVGCHRLNKTYMKRLVEAGVETGCFSPMLSSFLDRRLNYRNHRKIVIVDGAAGYFGGLNIGDEYMGRDPKIGYWRDTHFRMKGDAVLWLQYTFLTDWYFVKGEQLTGPEWYPPQNGQGNEQVQVVKSGPDETILELIFTCAASARKRIYMETPYFVPDAAILLALKTAAACGVDVRIILPAVPDSKIVYWAALSYVEELLQAGVRFFLYEKGFIHAKVVIADDLACSGSANMDIRSLCGQFELNAVFYDEKTVNRLLSDFQQDLLASREVHLPQYEKRPVLQKSKEALARLFSPLF